ncbi:MULTISPECIES: response regulator [unclassified Methanosarcina]|uniref:response regulator n=1 Tax=unclassified Methanosarcina TaxID=2644672 RepID=UPI0006154621|nr:MULTISPECIES: response regulator [unclassified Methanosarcina]AKB18489.1 Response regulator receiver [Methanosarcina sp. WWM596]AKB21944.1 Response regulator receiver [Methanosarcina sp. WH1]
MKVLIVDDDPSFLELSKTFLEVFHNIPSDTVDSAREALKMLEKDSYDVIVSDYDMPVMNGLTLLKTIRDNKIDIPFILFTGVGEELMYQAMQNGANSFILKTSDPKTQYSELSKRISQVANSNRAQNS